MPKYKNKKRTNTVKQTPLGPAPFDKDEYIEPKISKRILKLAKSQRDEINNEINPILKSVQNEKQAIYSDESENEEISEDEDITLDDMVHEEDDYILANEINEDEEK
mmetsp:Transcript_15109/g.22475  ORF Transcript_15109/g.22475 Transcript_15109/m.22475 type:complete len:107 (-) Transcript_15109:864-1184(-)